MTTITVLLVFMYGSVVGLVLTPLQHDSFVSPTFSSAVARYFVLCYLYECAYVCLVVGAVHSGVCLLSKPSGVATAAYQRCRLSHRTYDPLLRVALLFLFIVFCPSSIPLL